MRKVFASYSHRLDQKASEKFRSIFADDRDVFIDTSIREDVGDLADPTIKAKLRKLIAQSTVTVVLIGAESGGRWWIDWEIYNSLRKSNGNDRNGLLGVRIPYKQHWVPQRLSDNIPTMGHIIDWPRDYRTLKNEIEKAYEKRWNKPAPSERLRSRNSSR